MKFDFVRLTVKQIIEMLKGMDPEMFVVVSENGKNHKYLQTVKVLHDDNEDPKEVVGLIGYEQPKEERPKATSFMRYLTTELVKGTVDMIEATDFESASSVEQAAFGYDIFGYHIEAVIKNDPIGLNDSLFIDYSLWKGGKEIAYANSDFLTKESYTKAAEDFVSEIAVALGITNTGSGVIVSRPINGISLNGDEYILDDDGHEIVFSSEDQALEFLVEKGGYTEENVENSVNLHHSVGTCKKCGFPLFQSRNPDYKYECFNCDENFYGFEQEG